MLAPNNDGLIIGRQVIVVTMMPGRLAGTFDVHIDCDKFQYGIPLATQCLLQAAMSLLPEAYRLIAGSNQGGSPV